MTNLTSIVRATRASYSAVSRMSQAMHGLQWATEPETIHKLTLRYNRAKRDFERAQRILDMNPLPGDQR